MALSCKGRGFRPSCSTKRALLWAELVREKVLRRVAHRHVVFTLPKMLRPIFRYHRELLPGLCLRAWEALRDFFDASLSKGALPSAILTINTASEFLGWNPPVHGLETCGGFLPNGGFEPVAAIDDKIAWLTSPIPEAGAQMTHYFGSYSNAHRGKQAGHGASQGSSPTATAQKEDEWIRSRRATWARLVRQVFEADPLLCERGAKLKIVSVIEARTQSDVVGKILKHIRYQFEVLAIPGRPPPPTQPCLALDWRDADCPV